ncbi:deoxyribose-phosphate aldolase [Micromonospora cathayae]|uniref:Deoxyribose-phosphate aldolase n=1 Tax=Micromonospora cathayae TaxID=3028804 RepID=A0ABY7ZLD6_9ACTN|nr:deoxyribose-phosphate aldolase [Micromonospora sp. HUAS 3]WDZ83779.1 deoxyribose-phosphate aldolase [Micromonospora sp. HUAS 3]
MTTDLAPYIQHTLIDIGTDAEEMARHWGQAVEYGFDAAMVAAIWVPDARAALAGTGVKVASALDFPFGATTTEGKVAEARALARAGVDEIDIGVHIGYLRSGRYREYRDDIAAVVRAVDVPIKVMLELPRLSERERDVAVDLAVEAGVAWVKNASSGAAGVATPADIAYLRARVPAGIRVKASGGITSAGQVRELLDAGADLVGTSAGLSIIGVESRPGVSY